MILLFNFSWYRMGEELRAIARPFLVLRGAWERRSQATSSLWAAAGLHAVLMKECSAFQSSELFWRGSWVLWEPVNRDTELSDGDDESRSNSAERKLFGEQAVFLPSGPLTEHTPSWAKHQCPACLTEPAVSCVCVSVYFAQSLYSSGGRFRKSLTVRSRAVWLCSTK